MMHLHFDWKICEKARSKGSCVRGKDGLFPCERACKKENGVSCIHFSSKNNPYTCAQCPNPPCMYYPRFENIPLEKFMEEKPRRGIRTPLCIADAIEFNGSIKINSDACIGCLLCAAHCPISGVSFDAEFKAHLCSPSTCSKPCIQKCPVSAVKVVDQFDAKKFDLLKGCPTSSHCENLVVMSSLKSLNFTSFLKLVSDRLENLFQIFENKNNFISWSGNAFRLIFDMAFYRTIITGYEIPVKDLRPMRLELAVRDEQLRFFFFVKFKRDVKDFRFIDRHLQSRKSIKRMFSDRKKLYYTDFLVTACPEEEIFSSGIIDPSLLSRLEKYCLPLVSFQVIYTLLALKLFFDKKISFIELYDLVLSKENKLYLFATDKSFKKHLRV